MENAMYKTVLFDLDGTLTDPGIGITNSVMYALGKFGISVADRSELYRFIGPPLIDSFTDYYGFDHEKSELAVKYYREYFTDIGIFENKIYDGVADMLTQLKSSGIRILLATSKPDVYAVRILEHFGIAQYFDHVAAATLDGKINHKDEVIRLALTLVEPENKADVLMVGDRKYDITGANKLGIDSVGVLYGYGNEKELTDAGATYIAADIPALIKAILN